MDSSVSRGFRREMQRITSRGFTPEENQKWARVRRQEEDERRKDDNRAATEAAKEAREKTLVQSQAQRKNREKEKVVALDEHTIDKA